MNSNEFNCVIALHFKADCSPQLIRLCMRFHFAVALFCFVILACSAFLICCPWSCICSQCKQCKQAYQPTLPPASSCCCWLSRFDRLIPTQSPLGSRGGRASCFSQLTVIDFETVKTLKLWWQWVCRQYCEKRGWWWCWAGWSGS